MNTPKTPPNAGESVTGPASDRFVISDVSANSAQTTEGPQTWEIRQGDVFQVLPGLPNESVQCCVTSPPYYGLRDYAVGGQIGLEATPDEYVTTLVSVFREVRRVLRNDGTVWLNIGDSYAGSWGAQGHTGQMVDRGITTARGGAFPRRSHTGSIPAGAGYKPKDLLGIPWQLALALRADGWFLRSDIIWAKPNPMPESVTDRPTSAHEHVFLLSKSARYFYDADAIREDAAKTGTPGHLTSGNGNRHDNHQALAGQGWPDGRNRRNVWEIATMPYPEAHFATFPPRLVDPCVRAGTSPRACGECGTPWRRVVEREYRSVAQYTPNETARFTDGRGRNVARMGDGVDVRTIGWEPTCGHEDGSGYCVVIDPFAGAGTTGLVALRQERSFIGIELNPDYAEMARRRIRDDAPLLNTHTERGELAGRGQSASSTEPPRRGESASPAEPPPRGDKTS